jgi:transmembrane 9 superfamily protein 2/4
MPFCRPAEGIKRVANSANPGTILEGLRIENSPYEFTVNVKETGKLACSTGHYSALTKDEVANLKTKIDDAYRINMILDNLPVTVYDLLDENQEFVRPGFELGYKDEAGKYYMYNHLVFNVLVSLTHGEYTAALKTADTMSNIEARRKLSQASSTQQPSLRKVMDSRQLQDSSNDSAVPSANISPSANEPFFMIVGFEVSPCSIHREAGKPIDDIICGVESSMHTIKAQEIIEGAEIAYTYDVYWQESSIKWASRWDAYLRMPGGKVHW